MESYRGRGYGDIYMYMYMYMYVYVYMHAYRGYGDVCVYILCMMYTIIYICMCMCTYAYICKYTYVCYIYTGYGILLCRQDHQDLGLPQTGWRGHLSASRDQRRQCHHVERQGAINP